MGFILEINQPLLGLPVDFDRNYDGAGIDLVRFLLILEFSFFFQLSHSHQRQIHKTDKLIVSSFENLFMVSYVLLIGLLNGCTIISVFEFYILKLRREGGMAAVIGPIRIQHADLGHGRVTVLLTSEVVLDMLEILEGHSQI